MSHYTMEVSGTIGLSDYSNIYDYIDVVDTNDKFSIYLSEVTEDSAVSIVTSTL